MDARTPTTRRSALIAGVAILVGCCGRHTRAPEEPIAAGPFTTTLDNQAATFRNMHRLGPVRPVRCGPNVLALPCHAIQIADSTPFDFAGGTTTIDRYFVTRRVGGLLILKEGRVAFERYGMGATAQSRWASFSTAKSMTSTLVGAALHDGAMASLDDPAQRYLPVLRGSAYDGVSVRNMLRMCSGVQWHEAYAADGDSDIARLEAALHVDRPGALMQLMQTRPRAAQPGSRFNYSTGETFVLGSIISVATGRCLADYLSEKIWRPMGMEAEAFWQLDSTGGQEAAGYGIGATLKDYGRFGLFVLNDGVVHGERLLPPGWRDLAGQPDNPATCHGCLRTGYPLGYGYHWWSLPNNVDALCRHASAFTAQGIFGQFIYINPLEQVVAVQLSAWPDPWSATSEMETYALIASIIEELR